MQKSHLRPFSRILVADTVGDADERVNEEVQEKGEEEEEEKSEEEEEGKKC